MNAAKEATTPEAFEAANALFRDIAVVLRKNIVQASKVGEKDGQDLYSASHLNGVYPLLTSCRGAYARRN